MPSAATQADALMSGDCAVAERLAAGLLRPVPTNFVERPWGGVAVRRFKRLCPLPDQAATGAGLGEAFEVAAFDEDQEARAHPSSLRLDDGSLVSLARLLALHGETLLGSRFVARFGARFPLLPKTLDVKELLSVQGHPPGHTEAYVIIAADPGATIRLGFSEDVDAATLEQELEAGLAAQRALLDALEDGADQHVLQRMLAPWLAQRGAGADALVEGLDAHGLVAPAQARVVCARAEDTKHAYWRMLDRLNAIPVAAGQVIHNANPDRVVAATSRPASAEVHALGNPEGREVLALEIRRPGPTFRAWDNVRFPMRDVDAATAVRALNLSRTTADDFVAAPAPVDGLPGVTCSVDSPQFRVEHLAPTAHRPVTVPAQPPHSLHVLNGSVEVRDSAGRLLGALDRGDAALVPNGVGAYRVAARGAPVHVVKASVPDPG